MLKFIGKALAGMVLTKEAREAAVELAALKSAAKKAAALAGPDKDPALPDLQAQAQALVTPDRAALIRQAMEVRAAKQSILADLKDEDRAKLVATAMRAFLNESKSKE